MKKLFSLTLVLAMLMGCFAAVVPTVGADTIPANALKVHHVNKVVGSNQISVFSNHNNLAGCNPNGWGVYYQLRPTGTANQYSVVASYNNPGTKFSDGAWSFNNQSGDIYMQVNGATANSLVYSLANGTLVTFINLNLTTGDYSSTYVYAGKPVMAAGELINNKITKSNLLNSIGNVQKVAAASLSSLLSSADAPANVCIDATGANLQNVILACIDKQVLPTIEIDSVTEANSLIAAMNACGCYDVNVISADASALKAVREATNVARTGLIYNLNKTTLTSKEAGAIRNTVRAVPATFVVIDSAYANYGAVYQLRELGVAVWARVSTASSNANFKTEVINTLTAGVNGIITDNAAAVYGAINESFAENTMLRTPYIVGHRGNPNGPTAPAENSMESFVSAYENGADIFELDVYATTDGKLVIFHDYSLGTTEGLRLTTYTGTAANGALQNMSSAQIKQYKYKTGEEIAFFEDVLAYFKDKPVRIYVEFKGSAENTVKYTAKLLKDTDTLDRVVVITSTGFFMDNANKYFEDKMSLGYIYYPQLITNNDDWKTTDSMEECLEILAATLNIVQGYNGNLAPICTAVANGYLGAAVANRGLVLNPWGYAGNANNQIGFFSDVDSITTDDNQYFKDMIKFVTASDITLKERQAYDGSGFTATTYGRKEAELNDMKFVYSVVSGDSVIVKNGKLYAVGQGESKVVIGYKTKTTSGREYVLYSQVVTVNVNGIDETLPKPEGLPEEGPALDPDDYHIDIQDNITLGKSYTTSLPYRQGGSDVNWAYDASKPISYPDENGKTLTDGLLPTARDYRDEAWFGLHSSTPDVAKTNYTWVTVDLGKAHSVYRIVAYVPSNLGGGVAPPASIEFVAIYEGNETVIAKLTQFTDDETSAYIAAEVVCNVVADKIEVRMTAGGWNFISEVAAYGEESFGPAPGPGPSYPIPTYTVGDVNGNGKIDARDYLLLKRAYFGTYTLTCDLEVADVNGNGKIDARDYLLLKRAYFGTYTIK
ncbi:MAG: hypothetical protein IKU23_07795 [Clostridia bacterium]|nr:hypothetical protein [Clostridia bacterium]